MFLPEAKQSPIKPEFSCFRDDFLQRKVLDCIADAEANPSILKAKDIWGKGKDHSLMSGGRHNVQDMGI